MKKFWIILIALLLGSGARAQWGSSCLPEGITFSTQAQIDSFQVYYPNCTEILGDVMINGEDITNLYGLNTLTAFWETLSISDNPNLVSLSGLENIDSIGVNLNIISNDSLSSLLGLDNLTTIGGDFVLCHNNALTKISGLNSLITIGNWLEIYYNNALDSLGGFGNLTNIGGNLNIENNFSLTSISGLNNVDSIGGGCLIENNPVLLSLKGLENLNFIGTYLVIRLNHSLTSLTGLDNVTFFGESITITNNNNLSHCAVQSICDYLSIQNNYISFVYNATGCNSQQEVEEACLLGVDESTVNHQESSISILPNPASTQITIETPTTPTKNTFLTIFNINGQQLIQRQITEPIINVDVSGLVSGVYFVKVADERTVQVGKFVKQ